MFGIGVGAMAMVVVLSAFNGIEKLVEGLYTSFDPDISIDATTGKTFIWEEQNSHVGRKSYYLGRKNSHVGRKNLYLGRTI